MRRFFYVFIIALMSCGGPKEDTFRIEGSLDGLNSNSLLYAKVVNERPSFLDTIKVSGDKFSYDAPLLKENDFRFLVPINNQRSYVKMFLDNSDVEVRGSVDSLYFVKITGSKSNDLFKSLMNDYAKLSFQAQMLAEKIKFEKDSNQKKLYESMLLDNDHKKTELFIDFAKKHPDTSLSAWALYQIIKFSDYSVINPVAQKLSESAKKSVFYTDLNRRLELMKPTANGMPSPKFTLPDMNGNFVSLDDFKGKYVLLNFWSPTCSHCRLENPDLVRIYNQFGGKDFEIVGINIEHLHDKEIWKLVVEEDKLNYTQLLDTINYADSYIFSRTPFNVLLDREGKILGKELSPDKVDKMLNDILNK